MRVYNSLPLLPILALKLEKLNETSFFFWSFESRKSRNKRYNQRRSDGMSGSIGEPNREPPPNVTVENVSSDEEMVDIETTEEHSLGAHPTQRSVR